MAANNDEFGARAELESSGGNGAIYRIQKLEEDGADWLVLDGLVKGMPLRSFSDRNPAILRGATSLFCNPAK